MVKNGRSVSVPQNAGHQKTGSQEYQGPLLDSVQKKQHHTIDTALAGKLDAKDYLNMKSFEGKQPHKVKLTDPATGNARTLKIIEMQKNQRKSNNESYYPRRTGSGSKNSIRIKKPILNTHSESQLKIYDSKVFFGGNWPFFFKFS